MAESAAIAQLREQTGKVLTGKGCQSINFSLENVRIDGSAYYYVALALLNKGPNKVTFSINPHLTAGAQYSPRQNQFVFRSAGVAFDQGDGHQIMVHEATHAVVDATASKTKVLKITNEMCAYVAGGLFNILTGDHADDNFPIYREARAVAQKIVKTSSKWNYSGLYALSAADVSSLRTAILASPLYSNLVSNPNATYGDNGLSL